MDSHHAYLKNTTLIEFEGEIADDEDHDSGAVLTWPSRILSIRPIESLDDILDDEDEDEDEDDEDEDEDDEDDEDETP